MALEIAGPEADYIPITHVWSSFGHTFASTDSEGYESCLSCGALFELRRRKDDPSGGDYCASNGDDPEDCSGDTSMSHGYPGERVCECEEGCEHCEHKCNCNSCQ